MRPVTFILLLFMCGYFSMQEASLYFPEVATMLPLSSPQGILEKLLNFVVILVSVAGVIIAGVSKSKPKQHKEKAVQPKAKPNVKQKKVATKKRPRKMKSKASGSPFKEYFTDAKVKQK